MIIEINCTPSNQDILSYYSGRRLQYAIRMGILPTPENFSLLLSMNKRSETKFYDTQSKIKDKLASQVIRKIFSKANKFEHNTSTS